MSYLLTLEEEKRLVVLLAIVQLNGAATKSRALDLIKDGEWLHLSNWDLETMETRNELRWRNDLAFTRKHLVDEGLLDGAVRNRWSITPMGRQELRRLASRAAQGPCQKLKNKCVDLAIAIS